VTYTRCRGQKDPRHLYDDYRVEAPIMEWGGRQFALWGVSVQGYKTWDDVDALVDALAALLPFHR